MSTLEHAAEHADQCDAPTADDVPAFEFLPEGWIKPDLNAAERARIAADDRKFFEHHGDRHYRLRAAQPSEFTAKWGRGFVIVDRADIAHPVGFACTDGKAAWLGDDAIADLLSQIRSTTSDE